MHICQDEVIAFITVLNSESTVRTWFRVQALALRTWWSGLA